jgi:magnesium chelatase family protein
VPEFRRNLLQNLREPLESGRVDIARAGLACWYPADFQLIMTANPCPCGNLGRDDAACICTRYEIERYWKKLGGALLDRIDLRIPVKPITTDQLLGEKTASSDEMGAQVSRARELQRRRAADGAAESNARLSPGKIAAFCALDPSTAASFEQTVRSVSLSTRAIHSILKVARTIADIEGEDTIDLPHLYEAVQLRRYGEGDFFWS